MRRLNVAIFCATLLMFSASSYPQDVALPIDGKKVVTPLSADPPGAYTDLPRFGSIAWETRKLPWVDEGPEAGISGVAMAVHDGRIYLTGGFIPGGDETDSISRRTSRWTWTFDPETDGWERLADAPIRREYTRGIVSGAAFYVIGGGNQYKGQDPPYLVHGECAKLDLSADPPEWSMHSAVNVPRTHTSVGNIGDLLIVAGGNEYDFAEKGYSHKTIRDTTEVFDLTNPEQGWQIRAPVPGPARGWCGTVVASNRLYLFGGITWWESGAVIGTRETLRYDPKTGRWDKRTPPPLAVSAWDGGLYDNRYALLVGGVVRPEREPVEPIRWSDLVWAYDTQDDAWFRVNGVLPPGAVFNDPGVAVIGDTIYVLGAEGPSGSHWNYFLVGRIQQDGK